MIYWLAAKPYNYIATRDRVESITTIYYGFAEPTQTHVSGINPDVRRKDLYLKVTVKLGHRNWDWRTADALEMGQDMQVKRC